MQIVIHSLDSRTERCCQVQLVMDAASITERPATI